MDFWLGTHLPNWLQTAYAPLFVSARRLRGRKTFPQATCSWALDSGGFSELSMFGQWTVDAMTYSTEVRKWSTRIGRMEWAACQDWMCEPFILAKTGFTVKEHQRRTVANYLLLRQLAPDLPWIPVIQGFQRSEYLEHVQQYRSEGVRLEELPLVGLGSVCRRQHTTMAENLIHELFDRGIRLHGFGFKLKGLARCHQWLSSSDSMAWSYAARRETPMNGCVGHKNCANCLRYALRWLQKVLAVLAEKPVMRKQATELTRSESERRILCAEYVKEHGTTSLAKLSEVLGFSQILVFTVVETDWFERWEGGYRLSLKGQHILNRC